MRKDKKYGSKNIASMAFFWNAIYAGFSALQSSIILFAIARNEDLSDVGIVTIGFTVATLFMIFARYGIRNFQVTDTNEVYSFSDYFYVRVITVTASVGVAGIYLFGMVYRGLYTGYKGGVIFEIILLKMIDAFEDVYVGRFQQKGRLDIGARIASIRIIISTVIIFVVIWISHNDIISFFAGIMISLLIDVIMLPGVDKNVEFKVSGVNKNNIRKLLVSTFLLCVGMVMHNYIGNVPKYLVDIYLNDKLQAISGYIMMPMFVITVLNTFLMTPTVKALGDAWNKKNLSTWHKMIARHVMMITGASICILILGIGMGLPLLSWMYKVELGYYQTEFIIIMVGGTIYTLSAYAIVLLTAMRDQNWITSGCVLAVLIDVFWGKYFVDIGGLTGASWLYVVSNLALIIVFLTGIIMRYYKLRSRTQC